MSSAGRFQAAKRSGETYEVRMGEVLFAPFTKERRCIGTEELNGCTVVALVSSLGSILAHIPPLAAPTRDPAAGDRNVQELMDEFERLYRENTAFFPSEGTTWMVNAIFQGEIALPGQKAIVQGKLEELGLAYTNAVYLVIRDRVLPPKGTVFVDARGERPAIYVEDRLISG